MKKAIIFTLYVLFFWICLPAILVISSVNLQQNFIPGRFDNPGLQIVGVIILFIAVPLLVISIVEFKKFGKKYPISANPPNVIIQKGLFAIWRHPIYLFYTLTLFALAFLWGSRAMTLVVLPAFLFLEALYVIIEEKMLLRRFGNTYRFYKRRTRLIIPKSNDIQALFFISLFKVLFSYKVVNKDRIPDQGPYFVVSSHRNYLDPFFIGCAIPHPIRFITTYEMFRNPKISWYFRATNCIPKKRYLNDVNAGREIIRALHEEEVIGIFPEGERSWTGVINDIKPETLNLFCKFPNIPILPIKLIGNYFAWPRWRKRMGRSKLIVDIQQPIFIDQNWGKEEFENRLRQAIAPNDLYQEAYYCHSRNITDDISIVLYRCPVCRKFDAIQLVSDNDCICRNCQVIIEMDSKFRLSFAIKEERRSLSLDSIYQQIRVDQSDIVKRPKDTYPNEFDKILKGDEYLIIYAQDGTLFKEDATQLEKQGEGSMLLTNNRILFYQAGDIIHLALDDISSVTIEGNKKLHIYDFRQRQLYQVIVEKESALKWQDFIATTIQKEFGRIPNTR